MRHLLIRWAVIALAVLAAVYIVPGINVDGNDGFITVLIMAAVLGVVNTIVKPIVKLFSLPVIALTLGLFLIVINAAMLGLASWLVPHFNVDGILPALGGAIIISIVSWLLSFLVPDAKPA
jgi:putative membrane protein